MTKLSTGLIPINSTWGLAWVLREAETNHSMQPPAVVSVPLLTLTGFELSEIAASRRDNLNRTASRLRRRDAIVELRKPPGSTACVMKIEIEPGRLQLYVKL